MLFIITTFVSLLCLMAAPIISHTAALWAAIAVVIITSASSAPLGLAINMFFAVIRELPNFSVEEMHTFHGVCWVALAISFIVRVPFSHLKQIWHSKVASILVAFTLAVALRSYYAFTSKDYWIVLTFFTSMTVIVIGILLIDELDYFVSYGLIAVAAACLVTIFVDTAVIYGPIPSLVQGFGALPTDRLRLAGLHSNPNATAKFLTLAICILSVVMFRSILLKGPNDATGICLQRVLLAFIAFILSGYGVAAAESKSVILALLIALSFLAFTQIMARPKRWLAFSCISAVTVIFACINVLWVWVFASPIKERAAIGWNLHLNPISSYAISVTDPSRKLQSGMAGIAASPVTDETLYEAIIREYRIGTSTITRVNPEYKPEEWLFKSEISSDAGTEKIECGLACTGQRLRLWSIGLNTVLDHWLVGIGFGGWKSQLLSKLGFPFDSPHNGILELVGEFGIAGLVLYLTLMKLVIHRFWLAARCLGRMWYFDMVAAIGLYSVALLLTELFEPTKFFAMNPHFLWIWPLLIIQERIIKIHLIPAVHANNRAS